jgi:hypothetical protein
MADERNIVGQQVVDPHGDRVGKVQAVYVQGDEDHVSWALLKLGVIGLHSAVIPLHDAQYDDDRLRIVYEREHVTHAPSVEPDGNRLSDDDTDLLRRHYGLERVQGLTAPGADDEIELSTETRDAKPPMLEGERPPRPPLPEDYRQDSAAPKRTAA